MGRKEPLESYIEDIMIRLAKLDKAHVSLFIHGLTPYLKSFLVSKSPNNVGDAIRYARLGSSILAMQQTDDKAVINNVLLSGVTCSSDSPISSSGTQAVCLAINELREEIRGSRQAKPKICCFCKRKGHLIQQCFRKQK
jgi:hypothetical protein